MAERTVAVNGVTLSVEERGSGDTLVVSAQQEFGPDSYLWQLARPPFGYHVFAITLRRPSKADEAPGEAERPRWYARWSADVAAAIRALELPPVIYTGLSHGGVIGWHLAVEHPELLRGLVTVVGAPPFRRPPGGPPSGRASQMAVRTDPAAARANMERLFGPTNDPQRLARREQLIQQRLRRLQATPADEAAVNLGIGFPDVETEEELIALLGQVTTPSLLLGGIFDPWVTPEQQLRTARAVPGAKLVLFQDESHLLATESPHKILDEFALFVDRLGSTPAPREASEPVQNRKLVTP